MKKTVSFLLALIMVCCMAVPAYAADTRNTEVSLTIDESLESYEVTIPPTLTLDPATSANKGKTPLNITVNEINAIWSKYITINCSSKNGCYLINTEDSSKKIGYALSLANGTTPAAWGTQAKEFFSAKIADLTLPYNTSSKGGYITTSLSGDIVTGTYTDTLTFTIQLSTTKS